MQMFRSCLACTALAAVVVLTAAQPPPAPPTYSSYTAEAVLLMPYRGLTETIKTWFDAKNNRQRIDYDEGMDTFVYLPAAKMQYGKVPVITQEECFALPGPTSTTTIFPDMSQYVFDGQFLMGGAMTNRFAYTYTVNTKVNTLHFYALSDGQPIQFNFLGLDTLLGSHYDEYNITYVAYSAGDALFNDTTFAPPSSSCSESDAFPGRTKPLESLARMINPYHPNSPPHTALEKEFAELGAKYGREYSSQREYLQAMAEFTHNKRLVDTLNHRRSTPQAAWYRLNHMFDWSPERVGRLRGTKKARRSSNAVYTHPEPSASRAAQLPTAVDWRQKGAVGPVMDQGDCGSCWSFGTCGTIEGSYFLKTGKMVLMSQQELMDCSWHYNNGGCGGGVDFQAYEWIMANGGISSAASYGPYLMRDGWCHSQAAIAERKKLGVHAAGGDDDDDVGPGVTAVLKGYANVTAGSELALMDALATHGPISVSIDAALNSFSFYASGVYYEPNCLNGPGDLDHTVLAVGYGTENGEPYWIIKNSWSTHYGDDGYIKISRVNNNCGVATSATYVFLE